MTEISTLSAMAEAATIAGTLMPDNPTPGHFDTWAEFRTAFDAVDHLLSASIREQLEAIRPRALFVDEMGASLPDGEAWVVDAVDGAIQYLQGLPQWSVSIALVRDGKPELTALHSPFLGEVYTAARGGGAFLNGVPVTPSSKTDLGLALVGMSQPPFPARQPDAIAATGRAMTVLLPAVGAVRNLGPTSWQVADVASGRMDFFFEFGRDAGNLLAASLLVTEAGGIVTDADGEPWLASSESFVAASVGLHPQIITLFQSAPSS
jgi:myo-inositol-1(or 4)-monophosphatase